MHVVVCTVVHHPADARIYFRQIRALLDAGHRVTYIAPFGEPGTPPPPAPRQPAAPQQAAPGPGTLTAITIPRAVGRRRLGALRAARAALAANMAGADLLVVHDPELLLVLPPRGKRPPTVWDVHEDTAAALTTKAWLPVFLRPAAAGGVRFAERLAERRLHLMLAEYGYNARFAGEHPVVPNTTYVPDAVAPPSGPRRVVYVGLISPDRGSAEMTELGRLLAPHGISVELVGPADAAAQAHIEAADDAVHWHGFLPNEEALAVAEGALAGLSLLRDEANFRVSMPTKVHEYMARGLPVITTPLPLPVELVDAANCGFVVPFDDARAAAEAVLKLDADPDLRASMGARGHEYARRSLGWQRDAAAFVAQLAAWASPATEPAR
ncbi:MAG TPA: glycosyltransferase family 4 protein [Trebonia sp.]|nr:glycosyltransferase family 4 protein [Trebonia sp.]